jgi:DNA invertase Pin-like site-specific DNA recombinase
VVVECIDKGVSGGAEVERRPGLVSAVRALHEHRAGVLVIAKRDRLARDVILAASIERLAAAAGATVVSADGAGNVAGPEGQLMRGMIDLFAQHERALIRARTKSALAVKRDRGERVGGIPLGYAADDVGELHVAEHELAAVARAHELRAAGFSVRQIATTLDDENYPARGQRWHATTIARLLSRSEA